MCPREHQEIQRNFRPRARLEAGSQKLAIILGVNGSLGSAVALKIIREFQLDVVGLDLQQTTEIEGLKAYFCCDLRNNDEIARISKDLPVFEYREVVIICCTGLFGKPTFSETLFDRLSFFESLQVNLLGVSFFVISLIRICLDNNIRFRAIVVGSTAASVGSQDVAYGMSKAGLNGFVRSLSKSLSSQGIVAIGINPGIFESRMSTSVSEERQQTAIRSTHIGRIGKVDEVTSVIVYAALEAPDYLTGCIVNVNGGQYS